MRSSVNRSLDSKTTSFSEIPVVDLTDLLNGTNREQVAMEIGHICENVGFLYIKNHGVPQSLIDDAYRLTAALFALSAEEKQQLSIVHSGEVFRGYIPMYTESPDPMNTRDHKECFDLGKHYDDVSRFFGPNMIPAQIDGFREVFERYHDEMMRLSRKLIGAIALSLDLPEDYFEKLQRKPITIHRLNYYPTQHGTISSREFGTGAHTDYGFLTILHQDDVGGLQVQNRDGDWVSAPPVEGTFVVNIGDLVQTLSNDRYPATFHRVINTTGKARYSIPFFIDMDYDAVVEPVATCVSPSNPARYAPYTCGSYKYGKFLKTYTHLQTQ